MRKSPTNETKRERFKRLASLRTNEVLRRIKILGNCANRGMYDYREDEIKKIFITIENKVRETKARFHFPGGKKFEL